MALNPSYWEVTSGKAIRYKGGDHGTATANYVTVLELHRWLQDLADEASVTNDDFMDITTANPSDKKFDTIITLVNGFTLDDTEGGGYFPSSEFIYGGSIIQGSGGTETIYDGISVVANRGVIVNVIQNGAVLFPTNKFWNSTPDGASFAGINPDPTNGVAMRFMVKVKNSGSVIDNGALLFTTREWGKTFSEFRIPSTGRGVNVVPLTYATDLNNATVVGSMTGAPFTGVSNTTAGYKQIDLQQGDGVQEYYSEWNRGSATINQFYETMKYKTRNDETATLYGIPGELFRGITHSIAYSGMAGGEFSEGEEVTWTGGTAQVLANDQADNIIYVQLKTGVVPATQTISQTGGKSATSAAVVEKAISTPFCGQSTGSSLVGAYGFSLEYADLAVNDKIQALDGVTRQPPNNVTFTVAGVKYGWRVLVGPEDGSGGLKYDQLTATVQATTAGVTSITIVEAWPANTPTSGTLRIHRADGRYTSHAYSAVNTGTKTFTITSSDFSINNMNADKKLFIAYIDAAVPDPGGGTIGVTANTVSYNTVQSSNQTLYVEARYAGSGPNYLDSIKPAKTTATLGSGGGSATVSSVSDA